MRTINIDLPDDRFRTVLQRGLLVEDTLTTEKAGDRIRIVPLDRATGFAGSLWLPLAKK
jgi:hypothetical protein